MSSSSYTLGDEASGDHLREVSRQLGVPTWSLSCIGLVLYYFHNYYRKRKPKDKEDDTSEDESFQTPFLSRLFSKHKAQVFPFETDCLAQTVEDPLERSFLQDHEDLYKHGRLQYKLRYDFEEERLFVTVLQVEGFAAAAEDVAGHYDPYVRVQLLPGKGKPLETKVHRNTLQPFFDETFDFEVSYNQLLSKTLVLELHDFKGFSKRNLLGDLRIPLRHVDLAGSFEAWAPIYTESDKVTRLGNLCLSLRYFPSASKLNVIILECSNLKKIRRSGLSSPYVKITLEKYGKCLRKKKTEVKKCTLNPFYNESFTFQVSPQRIMEVHLVVTVLHYSRLANPVSIGKLEFGCSATGAELLHWSHMLASPHRPIAQWHVLQQPKDTNNNSNKLG